MSYDDSCNPQGNHKESKSTIYNKWNLNDMLENIYLTPKKKGSSGDAGEQKGQKI